MRYRSDIDGLRAMAVLFVLMFHGGISLFPSGFIGVDMFFVISGYLITEIIRIDIKKDEFSFTEFYTRRLWRLQPALLAILFFSLVISTIFYFPGDFDRYLDSANRTTLFLSNQFFAKTTTGYAAPNSADFLLLHTWSLAIEWQWYLFLPGILLLAHRYLSLKQLKTLSIILLIVALAVAYKQGSKNPDKVYYFFSGRIFEFLVGTCVAVYGNKKRLSKATSCFISTLSIVVLCWVATRDNIVTGYPNYHALLVSLACGALILSGNNDDNIIFRILSLKPIVYIGMISYSLYLWHWPVFALGHYLAIQDKPHYLAVCYLITTILAITSYYLIEKPLRKPKLNFTKSAIYLLALPIILFSTLKYAGNKYYGLPARFGTEFATTQNIVNEAYIPAREECFSKQDTPNSYCTFGAKPEAVKRKALMIGDSFSNHLWGFVNVLAKDANISVLQRTKGACLVLPGVSLFDWRGDHNRIYQPCTNLSESMFYKVKNEHYDYVILSQDWQYYLTSKLINETGDNTSPELTTKRYGEALDKAMNYITASGATPVIIKPTFWSGNRNQYTCYMHHYSRLSNTNLSLCDDVLDMKDYKWIDETIDKLKSKYHNIIVIEPKIVQCRAGICPATIGKVPVFRDETHLNDYTSALLGEMFIQKIGNPFK